MPGPRDHLVLLPGMMCDQRLWGHQINALSPTWDVTVPDIGGHENVAAIASSILASSPGTFALAGLSMGGIVALEMWRQAPQRIDRIALMDSNFRADSPERRVLRNQQIERVRRGELETVLRDELKPNYLAECHKGNSELLDKVLQMGLDLGADVFIRQSAALRDRPDSTATLDSIDCPTLVLCGEEDELCPVSLHREMAASIPGATLRVIDRCGHLSTMEQPEAVSTNLRAWLHAA